MAPAQSKLGPRASFTRHMVREYEIDMIDLFSPLTGK